MSLIGGCICGNVRYDIRDQPLFVHACHCADCQRFSGSAFVVLMGIAKADFSVTGATSRVSNPTPSGAGYDAHHCAHCATVIWSKYHFVELPILAVRAGTLDDPGVAPPTYHIFTRSKQPWFDLPPGTPTFDGWLEPADVWSPNTLRKIEAMANEG